MSILKIDADQIEKLQNAMEGFQGNTENVINHVLHNTGNVLIKGAILQFMPVSGRDWEGKKGAAKMSRSLTDKKENLAVTVKTTKNYQYLYFPDDGTNTRRHVGNQQFFRRGGEAETEKIIGLCIDGLMNDFKG